jgi:hypothetical protein
LLIVLLTQFFSGKVVRWLSNDSYEIKIGTNIKKVSATDMRLSKEEKLAQLTKIQAATRGIFFVHLMNVSFFGDKAFIVKHSIPPAPFPFLFLKRAASPLLHPLQVEQ